LPFLLACLCFSSFLCSLTCLSLFTFQKKISFTWKFLR
jgi:hypothetical protein